MFSPQVVDGFVVFRGLSFGAIRVVIVRLYHEGIAAETGPAGARKVVVSQGLEDPVVVLSRQ